MEKSPDAFRTISEVAEALETPTHVLRFWESRFTQIRPVKRAGGRRYYRPSDVALLAGIKQLLHHEGMTIRGVQKLLREQGVRHVAGLSGDAGETVDIVAARPPAGPEAADGDAADWVSAGSAGEGEPAPEPSAAPETAPRPAGPSLTDSEPTLPPGVAETPLPPAAPEPPAVESSAQEDLSPEPVADPQPEADAASGMDAGPGEDPAPSAPDSAPESVSGAPAREGAGAPVAAGPSAGQTGGETGGEAGAAAPAPWYFEVPLPGQADPPDAPAGADAGPAAPSGESPPPRPLPRRTPEPTLPPEAWPENLVTRAGLAGAPPPRPAAPDPQEPAPDPGPTFAARLRAAPPPGPSDALRALHDRLSALHARMAAAARDRRG